MKMAASKIWLCVTIVTILITTAQSVEDPMTKDIQTEYFQPANLTCDNVNLNVSDNNWSKVESMQWLLPDASLTSETTKTVKVIKVNGFPYWISIDRVGDDEFGYYACIIVYKPVGGMPSKVQVVRWGLNVDGPDFTKLRDEYADHAIIGAIAAGSLLAVLGITCIIWHYRYNVRQRRNNKLDGQDLKRDSSSHVYNNASYNDVDLKSEKSLDPPADVEKIDVHM